MAARGYADAEWDRLLPFVVGRRTMSPMYMATLAAYCTCWADYVEAELMKAAAGFTRWVEEVTVDSSGQEHVKLKPHPVLKDSRDAQREMRQHAQQLGITPATTSRVSALGKVEPAKSWVDVLTEDRPEDRGDSGTSDPIH